MPSHNFKVGDTILAPFNNTRVVDKYTPLYKAAVYQVYPATFDIIFLVCVTFLEGPGKSKAWGMGWGPQGYGLDFCKHINKDMNALVRRFLIDEETIENPREAIGHAITKI